MSARKRRKLDSGENDEAEDTTLLPGIVGEIDLEIGLKHRLVQTLQSRIAWARILQESLRGQKGKNADEIKSFRSAAVEAVLAIEAPSKCIFSREIPVSMQFNRIARPPPKQKPFPSRNPNARFLYISSAALGTARIDGGPSVQFYLLKCPTCSRTSFTSLQGLLNHARISHTLEWGTHDECVRACAVSDPNIDIDAGIEVGLGPSGVLPGLRTIFEMAVGTHSHEFEQSNDVGIDMKDIQGTSSTSLLTQTLGLHKDTPALAPFLGKRARRREITVWNEDDPVDIIGIDKPNESLKKTWRMLYAPRSFAAPSALQEDINFAPNDKLFPEASNSPDNHERPDIEPDLSKTPLRSQGSPLQPIINLPTAASRFHFLARVVISDQSLYIDPAMRPAHLKNHTHKWMISVDAPAYSYHITSILQRITVSPQTEPSSAALVRATTAEPPFVVVGTCDRPFLARVELLFVPIHDASDDCQKVSVEHWIELDLLCSSVVVPGEEQVLDVELDKQTTLKPIKTGYTPIDSKALWDLDTNVISTPRKTPQYQIKPKMQRTEVYEQILSELVKHFPMTLKDIKRTQLSVESLPYKLVSSPSHFKGLVMGRRKAIEWGRAKAIADAYASAIADLDSDMELLTTADVYVWLHEMGHFPSALTRLPPIQPGNRVKEEATDDHTPAKALEQWCCFCGLSAGFHLANAVKQESDIAATFGMPGISSGLTQGPCSIVPTELQTSILPMINIQHMLTAGLNERGQVLNGASNCEPEVCLDPHQLVSTSEPQLTLSIYNLIELLRLPTFSASSSLPCRSLVGFRSPLDDLGDSTAQVEARLVPYALLSQLTKRFIRELVKSGLEVANRDKRVALGVATSTAQKGEKRRSKKNLATTSQLLTPVHILNGVLARGKGGNHRQKKVDMAVFSCLARLGMIYQPVPDPEVEVEQNARAIKLEQ